MLSSTHAENPHLLSLQSTSEIIKRTLEYRLVEKIYLASYQHFLKLLTDSSVATDTMKTLAKGMGHPPKNTTTQETLGGGLRY